MSICTIWINNIWIINLPQFNCTYLLSQNVFQYKAKSVERIKSCILNGNSISMETMVQYGWTMWLYVLYVCPSLSHSGYNENKVTVGGWSTWKIQQRSSILGSSHLSMHTAASLNAIYLLLMCLLDQFPSPDKPFNAHYTALSASYVSIQGEALWQRIISTGCVRRRTPFYIGGSLSCCGHLLWLRRLGPASTPLNIPYYEEKKTLMLIGHG